MPYDPWDFEGVLGAVGGGAPSAAPRPRATGGVDPPPRPEDYLAGADELLDSLREPTLGEKALGAVEYGWDALGSVIGFGARAVDYSLGGVARGVAATFEPIEALARSQGVQDAPEMRRTREIVSSLRSKGEQMQAGTKTFGGAVLEDVKAPDDASPAVKNTVAALAGVGEVGLDIARDPLTYVALGPLLKIPALKAAASTLFAVMGGQGVNQEAREAWRLHEEAGGEWTPEAVRAAAKAVAFAPLALGGAKHAWSEGRAALRGEAQPPRPEAARVDPMEVARDQAEADPALSAWNADLARTSEQADLDRQALEAERELLTPDVEARMRAGDAADAAATRRTELAQAEAQRAEALARARADLADRDFTKPLDPILAAKLEAERIAREQPNQGYDPEQPLVLLEPSAGKPTPEAVPDGEVVSERIATPPEGTVEPAAEIPAGALDFKAWAEQQQAEPTDAARRQWVEANPEATVDQRAAATKLVAERAPAPEPVAPEAAPEDIPPLELVSPETPGPELPPAEARLAPAFEPPPVLDLAPPSDSTAPEPPAATVAETPAEGVVPAPPAARPVRNGEEQFTDRDQQVVTQRGQELLSELKQREREIADQVAHSADAESARVDLESLLYDQRNPNDSRGEDVLRDLYGSNPAARARRIREMARRGSALEGIPAASAEIEKSLGTGNALDTMVREAIRKSDEGYAQARARGALEDPESATFFQPVNLLPEPLREPALKLSRDTSPALGKRAAYDPAFDRQAAIEAALDALPKELQPHRREIRAQLDEDSQSIVNGHGWLDDIRKNLEGDPGVEIAPGITIHESEAGYILAQRHGGRIVAAAEVLGGDIEGGGMLEMIAGGRALESPVSFKPVRAELELRGVDLGTKFTTLGARWLRGGGHGEVVASVPAGRAGEVGAGLPGARESGGRQPVPGAGGAKPGAVQAGGARPGVAPAERPAEAGRASELAGPLKPAAASQKLIDALAKLSDAELEKRRAFYSTKEQWNKVQGSEAGKSEALRAVEAEIASRKGPPPSSYPQAQLPDGRAYEPPPDARAAKAQAVQAVKDLDQPQGLTSASGALPSGSGARTLGLAITAALKRGWVDLRGHIVKHAEDVAVLAQTFRDPRFETFRIIYTRGDTVVGHEGMTSRRPGYVQVFDKVATRKLADIDGRMKRMGADGYYLVHNHPSGRPSPSEADIALTRRFEGSAKGFRGHVVIDNTEYGFIAPEPKAPRYLDVSHKPARGAVYAPASSGDRVFRLPGASETDALLAHSIEHGLLGSGINSPAAAAALGKGLSTNPDVVTLLYLDSGNAVRAIQEVPRALFLKKKEFQDFLYGRTREFGAPNVVAYSTVDYPRGLQRSPGFSGVHGAAGGYVQEGVLLDAIVRDSRSGATTAIREHFGRNYGTTTKEFGREAHGQRVGEAAREEAPREEPKRETRFAVAPGFYSQLERVVTDPKALNGSGLARSPQANLPKSTPNGRSRQSVTISNLLESEAFQAKGLDGLSVPARGLVVESVLAAGKNREILDAVIKLLPVEVVNDLRRQKLAPEMLLHDESVLRRALTVNDKQPVSFVADVARAIRDGVAGVGAEVPAVSGKQGFGSSGEHLTAAETGKSSSAHLDNITQSPALAVAKALQAGRDAIGALAARPDSYTAKDWLREAESAGLNRKDARSLWNGAESRRGAGKASAAPQARDTASVAEALRFGELKPDGVAAAVRELAADPERLGRLADAVFVDRAGKSPEAVAAEVVKFARRVQENTAAFAVRGGRAAAPTVDLARVRAAFKGAEWKQGEDGKFRARIGGAEVTVEADATITVKASEQAALATSARATGGVQEPVGATYTLDRGVLVKIGKGAEGGVIDHEALHVAMRLALTDAERSAVLKRYGFTERGHASAEARAEAMRHAEERAAEAYSEWDPRTPNGLFGRIASYFRRIYRSFFPDAESVFGKVRSGEAFGRKGASGDTGVNFAAKPPPGQRGLPGIGEDIPRRGERPKRAEQADLFGARDMLQPSEANVTEGREGAGPLFTQEQDARGRKEAAGQESLPDFVRASVKQSLARLSEFSAELQRARDLDKRFGGDGRYEADAFENFDRAASEKALAEFRRLAPGQGVDAERALAEMGGVPKTELSKNGQAWLDDRRPTSTRFATARAPRPEGEPEPKKEPAKAKLGLYAKLAEAAKDETREPLTGKPGGEPDFAINLDRIGVDEDIKQQMARMVDAMPAETAEARGYESQKETHRLALASGIKPDELIRLQKQHGALTARYIEAGRILREEAGKDSNAKLQAIKEAESGSDAALDAERAYLASVTRFGAIALETVGAGAEAGRALAAHKMMSEGLKPEEKFFNKILRMHPAMNPKLRDRLAGAVLKGDQRGMIDAAREAIEPTRMSKFLEYWYNSILSGPPTQLGNISGNTVFETWRTAETGVAGGIDKVVSMLRGTKQERFASEMVASATSLRHSLPRAFSAFTNGLLHERVQLGSKYEGRVPAIGKGYIPGVDIGQVVRGPSRLLQAADDFAKVVAFDNKLFAIATRMALREGGEAGKVPGRTDALIAGVRAYGEARLLREAGNKLSETEQAALKDRTASLLWAESHRAALESTFQDESGKITKAVNALRAATTPLGIPVGNLIVPFTNVVSRILVQAGKRSPLGFIEAGKAFKRMKSGEGTQGEFSEALAKPMLGLFAGIMVYSLAKDGKITGGGPGDDRQRKLKQATGWQAYSVDLGPGIGWVSYKRMEPLSTVLGIAADLAEAEDEKTATNLADKLHGSIVQRLTDASYVKGITSVAQALEDPKRYGVKWARDMAGSIVPNVVRKAAVAVDPTIRDSSGFAGSIAAGIPGLSQTLPERKGGTGEATQRSATAIERFLSPFPRSEKREGTELESELLELDYAPGVPQKTLLIPGSKIRVELTERELDVIHQADARTTAKLRKLIQGRSYLALDGEARKELIEREYSRARRAARELLYGTPSFIRRFKEARTAHRQQQAQAGA